MPASDAQRSTEQLRVLVLEAEKAQDNRAEDYFSTSLTDDDRRYLDLCAELYARGEYEPRSTPCPEEPLPT